MNKFNCIASIFSLVCVQPAWAEVLQSISDDNVNVVIEPQSADKERHFEYRVFCSPGDEPLDDCQASNAPVAVETKPTMVLPLPDFPPEAREPEPIPSKAEHRHTAPTAKSANAAKAKSKRGDKHKLAAKHPSTGKSGKNGKVK